MRISTFVPGFPTVTDGVDTHSGNWLIAQS